MKIEEILRLDAPEAARLLLGWQLYVTEADGTLSGGIIAETEAYMQHDAASHSYNGKTPRNEVMFGQSGRVYVYFTYGMHWCLNLVTGQEGDGQAVLIRALIPTKNLDIMYRRRSNKQLTDGPAKLCQALNITGKDNGVVINDGRFLLLPPDASQPKRITATERVGIKKDTQRRWRYILA